MLGTQTKDPFRGLKAVFGFPIIAPQIRRRSSADLRFLGVYCDRHTDRRRRRGIVESWSGERSWGKHYRPVTAECERSAAMTARRSGSPSVSASRPGVGAGSRGDGAAASRLRLRRLLGGDEGGGSINANGAAAARRAFRQASSAARSSRACSGSRPGAARYRASPSRPP